MQSYNNRVNTTIIILYKGEIPLPYYELAFYHLVGGHLKPENRELLLFYTDGGRAEHI